MLKKKKTQIKHTCMHIHAQIHKKQDMKKLVDIYGLITAREAVYRINLLLSQDVFISLHSVNDESDLSC